jgi:hypothetical protein
MNNKINSKILTKALSILWPMLGVDDGITVRTNRAGITLSARDGKPDATEGEVSASVTVSILLDGPVEQRDGYASSHSDLWIFALDKDEFSVCELFDHLAGTVTEATATAPLVKYSGRMFGEEGSGGELHGVLAKMRHTIKRTQDMGETRADPTRLYISQFGAGWTNGYGQWLARERIGDGKSFFIGENLIDSILAAEGVDMIHPEYLDENTFVVRAWQGGTKLSVRWEVKYHSIKNGYNSEPTLHRNCAPEMPESFSVAPGELRMVETELSSSLYTKIVYGGRNMELYFSGSVSTDKMDTFVPKFGTNHRTLRYNKIKEMKGEFILRSDLMLLFLQMEHKTAASITFQLPPTGSENGIIRAFYEGIEFAFVQCTLR